MRRACVPLLFGLALGSLAHGCGSSSGEASVSIGGLCTPSVENDGGFSGFNLDDVSVETASPECGGGVCLVNHFRGRRSCPYGQTQGELDGEPLCFLPGTNDAVTVPVAPQLTGRRATETVYCSCRCANAEGSIDDGGSYCRCPSGFDCELVIPDVGLGSTEITGAYCIKAGTRFNPVRLGTPCDRVTVNCDD